MSKLFLWKLGDLDNKIIPTKEAINRLKDIISGLEEDLKEKNHAHLIWGPELSVKVFDIDEDAKHVVVSTQEIDCSSSIKIDIEENHD